MKVFDELLAYDFDTFVASSYEYRTRQDVK